MSRRCGRAVAKKNFIRFQITVVGPSGLSHTQARSSIAAFSMVSLSSHLERKTSRSKKITGRDEASESSNLTEGKFEGTTKCGMMSLKIIYLLYAHVYLKLYLCSLLYIMEQL